jgi:RNA polymerase sigma-70 factor (ECF subfamily)
MQDSSAGAAVRAALERTLLEDGDRLYAFALRVTRDPDLAADAVQEAFAAALARADQFRGESALSTWLFRIAYTKSIDLLRRRGREEPLADETGERGEPASWSRPPDEILAGEQARASLEEALGELSPVQRAVFELREGEGRPTQEVAEILGLPEGTVRVHLHRARLRLRSILAGHLGGRG